MDIYIKGHKDLVVASELVPVESSPVYNEHADIEHAYTAYGGYIGYAYVDSYSYHLTVGNSSYLGYTHIPIKLSYNKSKISYQDRYIDIDYDVYMYQLDELVTRAATRGVDDEENEAQDPETSSYQEPYVPQYTLVSDISTRRTQALYRVPEVTDEEISYEYNSYTSYSYSYAYLASYSYFHHDWSSYSYSYSYTAYSYDSYITATTITEWVEPLTSNSIQTPSDFTPYQYMNPDIAVVEGPRE